jgi:hypothetical protein
MTQFEFIFIPYSLILGLSMIALLSGIGKTIKTRLRLDEDQVGHPIGVLTPLLGLFVMLDLLSFWYAGWVSKDLLSVSTLTLLGVTAFASCYYLASYMVFPDQINEKTDLNLHYFRVRRIVMGLLLVLTFSQLAFYAKQPEIAPRLLEPLSLTVTMILLALMIASMIFSSVKINIAILSALILRYVVIYTL